MSHQDQVQIYRDAAKREGFTAFLTETTERLGMLQQRGYTVDQAIELLKLYALQGVSASIQERE